MTPTAKHLMTYRMRHELRRAVAGAALLIGALTTAACRSTAPIRAAAPPTRQPEPVAPAMVPTAVPAAVALPTRDRDRIRMLADSATGASMWRNARWGILIVDAASGDTIVAHDADRLFMPASNQKLLTAAIAVQHLGPDFTWRTPVLLRGRQRGTVWEGDLLIVGSGDPSFSDTLRNGDAASAFDPISQALAARGIKRITGAVRSHGDAFTGPTTGFGWEIDDLDASFGAPVDELMFNEGELAIRVRSGAKTGAPVSVVRRSPALYPRIVNLATTRDSAGPVQRVRAEYDTVANAIVVTGTLLRGDSTSLTLSYRHPADAVVAELSARLMSAGIAIRGDSLRLAANAATDTLVVLQSPPLSAVLPRMLKPSQNQIAELLFRTSGLRASGDGSADSARAVGARTLAALGVSNEDVAYRDGSGLSRHDYVTPRAVVRVLDAMRRSPTFDAFRNALPLAGVDGTLHTRMRGTAAAGNAQAKTGTVDKARSLSGYVTTADGRLVMFSMLANNFTVPTREAERLQDVLVVALANARLGDATPSGAR
jgi:D-alanyl-D-alanine carboxypeptidase/D-alanyl-D-alanine-endopeptidase (penicillin-binding protein 4)